MTYTIYHGGYPAEQEMIASIYPMVENADGLPVLDPSITTIYTNKAKASSDARRLSSRIASGNALRRIEGSRECTNSVVIVKDENGTIIGKWMDGERIH